MQAGNTGGENRIQVALRLNSEWSCHVSGQLNWDATVDSCVGTLVTFWGEKDCEFDLS